MIKTWQQRCEEHPDHNGIVSEAMIRARMQEEIDELRTALESRQWKGLTDEDRDEILSWVEWKLIGNEYVAPQKIIAYVEKKLREKNNG